MYDNTIFVILLLLIVLIYMLPTLIAYARDIPQRMTVTVVNIVLGWTLIGWFLTFLWASLAQSQTEEL
jgi:Superinfection immunity protein